MSKSSRTLKKYQQFGFKIWTKLWAKWKIQYRRWLVWKLDQIYPEETVLPDDGLYRYLYQPGEQHGDQRID